MSEYEHVAECDKEIEAGPNLFIIEHIYRQAVCVFILATASV